MRVRAIIFHGELTRFIGREQEVAEVKRLVAATRLLTLTGSGGCGKTRLALRVAADLLPDFVDGVWIVDLAPLSDAALLPQATAAALGMPEQPRRRLQDTLVDFLGSRTLLLVLDNCEHLVGACAALVSTLLAACPGLRFLATSRESLGVAGETRWAVPPLSLPRSPTLSAGELLKYDAVCLFVDRALAADSQFSMSDSNARVVGDISRQLDGIPLAIEMAAAWVRLLTPGEILNRLSDRFRLLRSANRDVPARHRTVEATIDWSYGLLSESERALLTRLAVFRGSFGLQAAAAVWGETESSGSTDLLEVLTGLVDKSLVLVETPDGEARYRLLETFRQYGLNRLEASGEFTEVRRRHRDWYLSLAERAWPEYFRPHATAWAQRLESEHDNLRTAMDFSRAEPDGAEATLRLAGSLWWFLVKHGDWSEAREWIEAALVRRNEAPPNVLPRVLRGASNLAWRSGNDNAATRFATEGLAISRQLGISNDDTALLFLNLGAAAWRRGDLEEATAMCTECLEISRKTGNRWVGGEGFWGLGVVANIRGDLKQATALHTESLAHHREVGDKWAIARSLEELGAATCNLRDYGRAHAFYRESLEISLEIEDRFLTSASLEGLAKIALPRGDFVRAARLFGASETLREPFGYRRTDVVQAAYESDLASVRTALGDVAFTAAWTEGKAMVLQRAAEYALASPETLRREGKETNPSYRRPNELAPRERAVAALIVEGKTNREIATHLAIRESTAETHVRHILNKLGVNSRAQIAAWAILHGVASTD
jgi:predicted ATPase/DNA-binding CsgD family transcriptional regulator